MQLNGVHHIGINVRDLDQAEKFYTDVLGFQVTERYSENIRHLMLDTGHTTLHLFESPNLNIQEATERLSGQGLQECTVQPNRRSLQEHEFRKEVPWY